MGRLIVASVINTWKRKLRRTLSLLSGKTICLAVGHVVDGLGSQWSTEEIAAATAVSFLSQLPTCL